MPRGGSKPGERRGGRQKGTPNKLNSTARQAFLATFGKLEGELEDWIRQTAEGTPEPILRNGEVVLDKDGKTPLFYQAGADPAKAADLLIRMAEYHFPKRGRIEVELSGGVTLDQLVPKRKPPTEGAH